MSPKAIRKKKTISTVIYHNVVVRETMGCLVRSGLVLCVLQGRISCNVIMKIKTRHRMDGRQRSVVLRHGRRRHTPLTESLLRRVHRAFMAISGYFFFYFFYDMFFIFFFTSYTRVSGHLRAGNNNDNNATGLSCVCAAS